MPVSKLVIAHRAKSGEVEYLSTILRDLTEHKEAEHALRQREETFKRRLVTISCYRSPTMAWSRSAASPSST